MKREKYRRFGLQSLTFIMAFLKLYSIGLIQGSMTIYNAAFGKNVTFLKMTFLLGLIIFGNIVDNISQPKWVALFV